MILPGPYGNGQAVLAGAAGSSVYQKLSHESFVMVCSTHPRNVKLAQKRLISVKPASRNSASSCSSERTDRPQRRAYAVLENVRDRSRWVGLHQLQQAVNGFVHGGSVAAAQGPTEIHSG